MSTNLRLRVDPVACDAFGHCAELVPELIWLDEWGYPVLDDAPVPGHLTEVVRQAVRSCPRKALFVERVADERRRSRPAPQRSTVVADLGNSRRA